MVRQLTATTRGEFHSHYNSVLLYFGDERDGSAKRMIYIHIVASPHQAPSRFHGADPPDQERGKARSRAVLPSQRFSPQV